jgi:L-threonylcarbamoyladenylate synthase
MSKSVVIKPHAHHLKAVDLDCCLEALWQGDPLIFPTDTVYGLGANAFSPKGIKNIYTVKGRSYAKALPLLLESAEQLPLVADDIPKEAWILIRHFWPGALTLVFKTSSLALNATHGKNTVAVRVPDHGVIRQILKAFGLPLATTSANLSKVKSSSAFDPVHKIFQGKVPVMIDDGDCPGSEESTVIDATHYPFTVLRVGAISKHALEKRIHLQ